MSVQGRADFTARIGDNEALGDSLDEPIVIQPDETIDVTVTFAPMSALRADSELLITSNAVNDRQRRFDCQRRPSLPCNHTRESRFWVGIDRRRGRRRDAETAAPVTLESCGTASLLD